MTADGTQLNLDALYQICPSCFTETKGEDGQLKHVVNFEKLRALLGDHAVEDAPEVYDFTWVGKRAAQREAMVPCRKTLRPCPEESVNWDTTQNLYIEGDNLEVLKLLQNSYMGKVKMIYIDPPYNTGNDFVYRDDFLRTQREEDEAAGVINEEGERMVKNTESNGKFHSDWCSMIYARLMVARSLLTDDGVIFISIDDNEVDNLKKVCNEVFGEVKFGTNQRASLEVEKLFNRRYFDFPKPVSLLSFITILGASNDSLILDFFSGSATTAHATIQLNAEDGGNRKFIMVQWPEETDEKSEAYKAGYKNICEIGKERIRRAGKKIKEEHPEAKDLDIGFRVFKCDESNYKEVSLAPKDYEQGRLELLLDNIKEDRTGLDLLFDCMLRWGVTLDLPMTKTNVDGSTIHNVNEGGLVACFDGKVTERVIDAIAEMYPAKVVFREGGDVKHIYFVAETKGYSSDEVNDYRKTEEVKIECARRHFAAISGSTVTYDVVKNYDELRNLLVR